MSSSRVTPEAAVPAAASRAPFFAVFPSIMLPMFLAALDQTIVATALPAIAGALGDVERVSWVVVSYLVAATIAAPVYGRLGDALGRKQVMFLALGIFIVASLFCAVAPSVLWLTAGRVLQGLGGGGLMTLSQALVGEAVPPRERGRYQGYLASVYMSGSAFGPVAGGILTQHLGWQSVFLVNLPIGALALLLVTRLPARAVERGSLRFDWLGVLLFATFIAPLLVALERAQRFSLAVLPGVAALLAVSVVALVLLLRQERRAAAPLLPIKLLRQAAIWRPNALGACIGASLVSMVTFVPMYLQVVRGSTPSQVGLLLLPLTMGVAAGALCTGRMVARTGRTAIFPSFGMVVVVLAALFFALFIDRLGAWRLPLVFGVLALAMGTAMPVVQTVVQSVAGLKQLGAAAASVQFSRSIGSAFGTALVGAVLFAALSAQDAQTAALFSDLLERGPGVLAGLPAARQAMIQGEITDAFRAAFLTIACFGGCAAVLAWTIPVRRI